MELQPLGEAGAQAERAAVIGVPGGLLAALDAIGILGDKRIPARYLRASARQRLGLLRGLMDTDGSVSHTGPRGQGQCEYSSKDERLARQVLELIRSLGYRASIVIKPDTRSRTGEQWRVRFRSRPDCVPFLLPRKADRCVEAGEQHYTNRRSIVLIEPVAAVSVRCITVDTSDHLFLVGDGFVPTHSSRLAGSGSPEPLVPDLQRAPGLPSTARASLPEVGPVIRSHLTCGATKRMAMAGQIK